MTGRIVTVLALALGMFTQAAAQDSAATADKDLQVLGILSLPQGDFGDDFTDPKGGGAATGFGVGVEYMVPMQMKNLQLVAGGYFIYNSLDLDEAQEELESFDVTIDGGPWTNISALGGVRMNDVAGISGLYVQGMVGLNYAMLGDYTFSYEDGFGDPQTDVTSFSPATTLAISLGVGKKFGKFDVGVRYLMFGEAEFDFENEYYDEYYDETITEEGTYKQEISMLAVTVGYSF